MLSTLKMPKTVQANIPNVDRLIECAGKRRTPYSKNNYSAKLVWNWRLKWVGDKSIPANAQRDLNNKNHASHHDAFWRFGDFHIIFHKISIPIIYIFCGF